MQLFPVRRLRGLSVGYHLERPAQSSPCPVRARPRCPPRARPAITRAGVSARMIRARSPISVPHEHGRCIGLRSVKHV